VNAANARLLMGLLLLIAALYNIVKTKNGPRTGVFASVDNGPLTLTAIRRTCSLPSG
jgi:hypothetical protein